MNNPLDWDAIRQRLAAGGRQSWRGLEELAAGDDFAAMLQREFPEEAAEWTNPVTRRQFLTLMGASLALAGVSGCSIRPAPPELILPYVRQPEGMVPGRPLYYATAMTLGGFATGLLVKSNEGRPTKIEGNPHHPASLGATDVFAQASVLDLYDPARSQSATHLGQPRAWNEALTALRTALVEQRKVGGTDLCVLTGTITSPTLVDQLTGGQAGTLKKEFPAARWYHYEPAQSDNAVDGARLAFGKPLTTLYNFEEAEVVFSLDADFLSRGPAHLRYIRQFMNQRRPRGKVGESAMNRLYVTETMPTTTGARADHRLPLRAAEIEGLAWAVAAELGVAGVKDGPTLPEARRRWVSALVKDLRKNIGKSIVLAGDGQPPIVHALAHAMNLKLKNVERTVFYTDPVEVVSADQTTEPKRSDGSTDQAAGLRKLTQEMQEGRVKVLLVLGGNPVFTAPADLDFAIQLQNVPLRVHLGLYQDETAVQCHWHIPEAHYLEAWGDARAFDGTVTILQPLIAPLYAGRSAHKLLSALCNDSERPGYETVRDYWRQHWPKSAASTGDFERDWERTLRDGVLDGSAFEHKPPPDLQPGIWDRHLKPPAATQGLEIVFRPDPTIHDGRFANNGWLQELPKPLTKLTWDNAAFVSPATAEKLGLSQTFGHNGGEHGQAIVDLVELRLDERTVRAPVWILPGHADDSVTVYFGHGRTKAGKVGNGTGFNAYQIRTAAAPWFGSGLSIRKTGETYTLACTQMHHAMEGREPVRAGTLDEYRKNRHFAIEKGGKREERFQRELVPGAAHGDGAEREPDMDRRLHPLALWDNKDHPPAAQQWGMAIDLTTCVGCGACVVACQSENNIPVVGKTEVTRGREMHWIRIDRYYEGSLDNPETRLQPVPCMHCENAPCEVVCPVAATTHSADGLNDMVYNRCVGTRYCSNNCPYKVRRFNFLQYADFATASLKLGRNPDVTVRSRGVMEKCTYCVQRIRHAQIDAEAEARSLRDGEIVTACQQACPADAIVFGDLNDPKSRVTRMKAQPLQYGLLAELNTRPRTSYLAELRNPNPELEQ